jgi:hypothetical protein
MFVDVEIIASCDCPFRAIVPLMFALLPGFLILAFAGSLLFEERRKRKRRGAAD